MAKVTLLLWDVGGVLLTNAWDRAGRAAAAARFHLDPAELERRHDRVADDFETGRMDLDRYLAATVFDVPRAFDAGAFRAFMWSLSAPHESALACARAFRQDGTFVMVALNNESTELNEHRISTFHLREVFHAFLSSCYTGRRKPDPDAYRYALQVTQHLPEETLFLDDRPENVEAAARLGIRAVRVRDPVRVREELESAGVVAG
ncbi:MAG: HAD-IA family hydrolase [Thermoplasmata archaeon]|jgi:putative hydrolase of the HAD superfamily